MQQWLTRLLHLALGRVLSPDYKQLMLEFLGSTASDLYCRFISPTEVAFSELRRALPFLKGILHFALCDICRYC